MRYLAFLLVLVVACAPDRPSVASWTERQWEPMVQTVPQPADVTPDLCEEALGDLRRQSRDLDPAPSQEIREASHGWLTAAESLMFECASDPGLDYPARHERLVLRQVEVETLLEGS